eukprot:1481079-Amphidinium_carterae.1
MLVIAPLAWHRLDASDALASEEFDASHMELCKLQPYALGRLGLGGHHTLNIQRAHEAQLAEQHTCISQYDPVPCESGRGGHQAPCLSDSGPLSSHYRRPNLA